MIGTSGVVDHLRSQGWDLSPGYVHSLIRERVLPAPELGPGRVYIWTQADIDRLVSVLRRRGRGPVETQGVIS